MPELPEVEMVARSLRPRLVGRRLIDVESSGLSLRQPIDLPALRAAIRGAQVEEVRRIGKYLVIELSQGAAKPESSLLVHLGMSGRLVFAERDAPRAPHTHVVFRADAELDLRYVDPRRFGIVRAYARERLAASDELSVLGIDPLEASFTVDYLAGALAGARKDLKAFLLDQSRIAGIGNIYACEALLRARLSPRRRADRLGRAATVRLHRAIIDALTAGIANRGTSFSDYVDAEGASGDNQRALYVYGRQGEPCRLCATAVRRRVQGGRSTFYCSTCQR